MPTLLLAHSYTSHSLILIFLDNIFKLHGCSTSIISDWIPSSSAIFGKDFLLHRVSQMSRDLFVIYLHGLSLWLVTLSFFLSLADWWYNSSLILLFKILPLSSYMAIHHHCTYLTFLVILVLSLLRLFPCYENLSSS